MEKQLKWEIGLSSDESVLPCSAHDVADDVFYPEIEQTTASINMDLTSYFPMRKKPRRSSRLIVREVEEKKVQAISTSPLGYFDILPLELKFYVLGHLPIEELSLMTITSKAMRNLIECYRVTLFSARGYGTHSRAHSIMDVEQQAECMARYTKLGLLIKRSTCLYATKERLKIMNDFLSRMMCGNTECCKDRTRCIGELCFGKFLHTVIAGWDDSECQRTFDSLCQHTSMFKHIKIVVSSKPGAHASIEYNVRCFLRRVFLDPSNSVADKSFWMTRILKPWPLVQQARLLYLLYGVTHEGTVQWYVMCGSPVESSCMVQYFGGIACALNTLYRRCHEWTEDEIISILDEMTGCPEEWVGENKASLLISCGEQLTSKMLISKAINGRVTELCSMLTACCVVCVKHSYDLSFVMKHVHTVLQTMENSRDRQNFVNGLMEMFKELVFDLHEYSDTDDEVDDRDFFYLVSAFTEFSQQLIHLAFKPML